MTKTIVIAANTSWNLYNFRFNLAKVLKLHGHNVVLVAPKDDYSKFLSSEFRYYSITMNNKGTNPYEDFKTLLQYYQLYKKIKPDYVLNYTIKPNIYGNVACRILGIQTINNISGLGSVFITQSFITALVKKLYKNALASSSKIFFQNYDDKNLFIDNKLVLPDRCSVLPGSGINTDVFKPIKYTKTDDSFRFLLIARILWDKGIGEYVEAAQIIKKKYPNVSFQLLGSLDVMNPTAISKEQIGKWGLSGSIDYLGTTDNVQDYICQADCIVLPSYREGTPRSLLESASMAKPIITTNVPGCKDVVEDGINGFLCQVKNSLDLAQAMEKMLLLSDEKRLLMGMAGRQKMIREYNEQIVIDNYLKIIDS